ncbi:hypothetical protein JCM33774_55840 [Actinophytocola sp. KF-1]
MSTRARVIRRFPEWNGGGVSSTATTGGSGRGSATGWGANATVWPVPAAVHEHPSAPRLRKQVAQNSGIA